MEIEHMAEREIASYIKWIWFKKVKHANNALKPFGITVAQFHALEYIIESEGSVTQKDLEKQMDIQHSAVVGIVSRLEKKGYIVTAVSKQDRRQKLLIPTEIGRETWAILARDKDAVIAGMTDGFTEDEIRQLEELLMRIYRNLERC